MRFGWNAEKMRHPRVRPKFRNLALWSLAPRVWAVLQRRQDQPRLVPVPCPLPRPLMARTLRTQSSIATLPYRPGDHAVPGEVERTPWPWPGRRPWGSWDGTESTCAHTGHVSAPSLHSSPGICAGRTPLCLPRVLPFSRLCAPQQGCAGLDPGALGAVWGGSARGATSTAFRLKHVPGHARRPRNSTVRGRQPSTLALGRERPSRVTPSPLPPQCRIK